MQIKSRQFARIRHKPEQSITSSHRAPADYIYNVADLTAGHIIVKHYYGLFTLFTKSARFGTYDII